LSHKRLARAFYECTTPETITVATFDCSRCAIRGPFEAIIAITAMATTQRRAAIKCERDMQCFLSVPDCEGRRVAAPAYCFTNLKLSMDEKPEEIIIRCHGRITADSADMFQREVCGSSIPVSRGKGVPVINRIVLDLSNITHIDDAGLEALMDVWRAGQRNACRLEIINSGPQTFRLALLRRLSRAFRKMLVLFD
jgi:anti-anti-sigma regulatory factor